MMSVAVLKQHPLPRYPRFMVLDWAFRLPYASSFIRRVGGVVASPFNATRLLEQDHLVMVFPEDRREPGSRSPSGTASSVSGAEGSSRSPCVLPRRCAGGGRGSEEIYPRSRTRDCSLD